MIFENVHTEQNQSCNCSPTRSGNRKNRREEPKYYRIPLLEIFKILLKEVFLKWHFGNNSFLTCTG